MKELDKFAEEFGDTPITISFGELGVIMGRNITNVVGVDELMTSEGIELEANVAVIELLIKFCANLMNDIYDASKLEIEDDDGGNT